MRPNEGGSKDNGGDQGTVSSRAGGRVADVGGGGGGGGDSTPHRSPLPPPAAAGKDGQQQWTGGVGGGSDDSDDDDDDDDDRKTAKSLTAPSDDDDTDDGGEDVSSDGGDEGHGGNGQGDGDRRVPSDGVRQGPGVGGGVVAGAREGGAALEQLDPEQLRREERRARLNGLVDAAVERQRGQECNVAFVKTHKTASTTITAVLYRYGLRHGRRVARFKVEGTAVTLEHAAEEVRTGTGRENRVILSGSGGIVTGRGFQAGLGNIGRCVCRCPAQWNTVGDNKISHPLGRFSELDYCIPRRRTCTIQTIRFRNVPCSTKWFQCCIVTLSAFEKRNS